MAGQHWGGRTHFESVSGMSSMPWVHLHLSIIFKLHVQWVTGQELGMLDSWVALIVLEAKAKCGMEF